MRLKRLTLHGFKTFADKTTIEFNDGVTAIVGPNGSGKSNLLDALTWCLGEQKVSSLRASRAQDVIFAGSSRRKPMGMAEVSLTVDNEDRFLPLEFAEVTVTRRIYRSGDAEYLLNKVPCRLKDITDLFLDTGVGRGAYAIVNQSEIDSILSSRAEDRRELFEEAAGIKKYRVRKREARRKLEQTELNLVRVRDILGELGSALTPLEAQAQTARRYAVLAERLRAVEVGQLVWDYGRLNEDLANFADLARAGLAEAESLRAGASKLENSASDLSQRIVAAEGEMDRARLLVQAAIAEGERIERRIAVGAERLTGALRTIETLERDLASLAAEADLLAAEAIDQAAVGGEVEGRIASLEREMAAAEAIVSEADRALAELTRLVRGQEADYLEIARRLASQKAELAAVRARIAQREIDIADTSQRSADRADEAGAASADAQGLSLAADSALEALEASNAAMIGVAEPEHRRASESLTTITENRALAERRLAEQSTRLKVLEETESAQEGYYAGVRSVTRAVSTGRLSGRYLLVADALRVPANLDTAIEIALGGSLQDVITETQAEAKAAIGFLNETRGGRATFLPLDSLRDQDVPEALRLASKQSSRVLGSAADLVGYEPDVAGAVRVLLARVLIVDDLDTATRISRQLNRGDWSKIVTLSGEVVVPTGAITGGAQGRPGPNLLGRKREVAELVKVVSSSREAIDQLLQSESSAKADRERTRQAMRDAEVNLAAARDILGDAERQFRARANEADRLQREAEAFDLRARALEENGGADRAREAALTSALEASDQIDEGAQATREEMQARQASLSVRKGEAQASARLLGTEIASLRERVHSLNKDVVRAREGALRAALGAEERKRLADAARALIAQENSETVLNAAERDRVTAEQAEAAGLVEKWREVRQTLVSENVQIGARIKDMINAAQRASEQGQAARLRGARTEAQIESIVQRLMDEYELHPESAVALTGGEAPDRDTTQEIARLRREIKSLGPVNAAAVEEYERQSERYQFLTEQSDDLEAARSKLIGAISEIDDSTRGVFMETFDAVGAAFARLFVRLFGGGGGTELILTDPNDVLETGIEIVAQPPGKKRQNLALLSGGERALTATALLFAFLEVRPAPFCVLDEVDAPLDGANVEKFADLLRDFGTDSQFIVITHNATTMEAAPLWFGITMQEPGVSRGISMRAPDSVNPKLDAGDPENLEPADLELGES